MSFAVEMKSWDKLVLSRDFPLHSACQEGDAKKVVAILEQNQFLAIQEDTFCSWTPAHWAAYFGKLECLRHVVSAATNGLNLQTTDLSQSPCHFAAQTGQVHCLLWLLQSGANVNLKDFFGETALHKSARAGHAECVSLLIESSCNIRILNNANELASTVAERSGFSAIASLIHQAELTREISGKLPCPNDDYSQRFKYRISQKLHDFNFAPIGARNFNRKRRFGFSDDVESKRIRFGDAVEINCETMDISESNSLSDPVISPTSSIVEHENLWSMEQRYSSLYSMISEFHGF